MGKFLKSPNESKRYSIDYVDWLDAGEYLSAVNISVSPTTSPPLLNDVNPLGLTDTTASFFIGSGTTGNSYKLIVRVTTTNGQIKEDVVMIEVRAL